MKTKTDLAFSNIFGRAFVSSITLTLIETIMMYLVQSLVQIILYGSKSGIVGVNPFVSIISNAAFILVMRVLLGFTLFNMGVWCLIALLRRKISLPLACLANATSIFMMYCVWNWNYQIFHSLFYVKGISDLFGLYQTGLLCGLLSPIIAYRISLVPNILPVILKKRCEDADLRRAEDRGANEQS